MTKKLKRTLTAAVFCTTVATAVMVKGCMEPNFGELEYLPAQIRQQLRPIAQATAGPQPHATTAAPATTAATTYLEYYGLDFENRIPGLTHRFGKFQSGQFTLASHIYTPQKPIATVVLLHGYSNHCGQFRHLIDRLLKANYSVALYDLPGHGLSTGDRGAIDTYSQYTQTLLAFEKIVTAQCPGPYHLLGFSNGGGIVVDYLLGENEGTFDRIILAAPLIHNAAWKASESGYKFYSKFADSIPWMHRKNSSDGEFLKFNRNSDFLHCRAVPLKWVKAVHEWDDTLKDKKPANRPILVIQGDKDSTVDFKYNLEFIKKKLPLTSVTVINGARHELFNESDELRNRTIERVVEYLAGRENPSMENPGR